MDTARILVETKLGLLARNSSDPGRFWQESAAALREVVPFTGSPCWFTVDPATLLPTAHINEDLDRTPPEIARAWYQEDDVNSPTKLAGTRSGVATLTTATGGRPDTSWRWRHLLQPRGYDDSLDAVLRVGATVWGAVNFLHGAETAPFTQDDQRYLRAIAGTLGLGTKLGLLRSEAAADLPGSPAVLVVSAELSLLSATANAEAWLSGLPDAGTWRPDRLPMPVQVVALRAIADRSGESSVLVRSTRSGWVGISGSRLDGPGHPQVAVVVGPAEPGKVARMRLAAYGLTPREQEIVDQVLRGRSTRQIAAALFLSPYTVQDRLKAIFEKAGVRSRRDLVARVQQTEYAPVVDANDRRTAAGQPLQRYR